ncbi:FG-GAP-like repeat-containing protein [Polaromonas sp. A23]|uniref:FG-GAP-like repeat-containing protein n=1 Tax=Polaromonas sp. A23 TaxID=1944133 RepID=UPI00143B41D3|nr:FG-GAP-like repeat-containing protein [Polaromonas sp. A23]
MALVAQPASAQTTVAGTTPGQFSVNESGAATYSIPIQVPPGVAGMQPRLSLEYNSQGGNGLLGMGWNLSGLSAITRCPRTMAQDGVRGGVNYDMNDRFCMEGQRLLLVSGAYGEAGSEYRVEKENFSKITANGQAGNGPSSFVVKTKAGLTVEYGNTADSRIEAQGKPTAGAWFVNKIADIKGNYLTATYVEDNGNGEAYISRMDYTGNDAAGLVPSAKVTFSYQPRPDTATGYKVGSVVSLTKRMTGIQVYAGSAVVREYRFLHDQAGSNNHSRLTSVVECDGQGAANCLQSTNLAWNNSVNSLTDWQAWNPPPSASVYIASCQLLQMADVNGDGLADLVCAYNYGSGLDRTYIKWSQAGGFTEWQALSDPPVAGLYMGQCQLLEMVDINGDGLADQVCAYNYGSGLDRVFVRLSQGNALTGWQGWSSPPAPGLYLAQCQLLKMVDVNGDGLTDQMCAYNYGSGLDRVFVRINQGSAFTDWQAWSPPPTAGIHIASCQLFQMADVNGDGLADQVCAYNYGSGLDRTFVRLSQGDAFTEWQAWTPPPVAGMYMGQCQLLQMVDVNGDGLTDQMCAYNYGSGMDRVFVRLSQGLAFTDWQTWSAPPAPGLYLAMCQLFQMADVNGDGLADQVCGYNYGSGWDSTFVRLSQGNMFTDWQNWRPATAPSVHMSSCQLSQMVDVNGDGLADQLCAYNYGSGLDRMYVKLSTSQSNRLTTITSGLGATTSIELRPLTDNTIYTKDGAGNASVYPKIDLQYPQYVVSTVSTSNGLGGVNTVQYNYGGLKAEQGTGRGSLGFRWMKSKSVANNIESYTEFNQTYPFTGNVTKNETRLAGSGNAGLLKRTVNTYAQSPGSAGASVFVYPSQSVEESWDLSGTPYPGSTTSYVYGQNPQYGDPTQITVSNSEGSSKATANEYWPVDSNNWILGRLKKASVTSVKP